MKRSHVVFLTVRSVLLAHAEGLRLGGGSAGVRDAGQLDSAVKAPRSGYYDSLAELAAAYCFGIARGHAFVDGNKRAAFYAALMFLEANGYRLTLDRARWRRVMRDVAAGRTSRKALTRRYAREMGGDVRVDD